MRKVIFLASLCLGTCAQVEMTPIAPITREEFLEKVEGISLSIKRDTLLYKFMLEPQAIKHGSSRVQEICDSMISTIPATSVTEHDFFVWKCEKEQLSSWLGDLDKYSYAKPQVTYLKRPTYPKNAREEAGYVILSFDITKTGNEKNIKIVESSNQKFNEAAIRSAKTIQYVPAHKYGEPIDENDHRFRYDFSPH